MRNIRSYFYILISAILCNYTAHSQDVDKLLDSIQSLNKEIDMLDAYISAPSIMFSMNSTDIDSEQVLYIEFIADIIDELNDTVYIYGYASEISGDSNYILSLNRAEKVKSILIDLGCRESIIKVIGMGSKIPFGDACSAMCRRAIIVLPYMKDLIFAPY